MSLRGRHVIGETRSCIVVMLGGLSDSGVGTVRFGLNGAGVGLLILVLVRYFFIKKWGDHLVEDGHLILHLFLH